MNTFSNSQPTVLISIVTWNHERSIQSTLDSIFSQSFKNLRTVVFDNNSSDGTIEVLESYVNRNGFELIKHAENIGFCGGHNHVIKKYDFDFIFLVNPDTILAFDYVEKTLEAFEKDPQIGAVCGLLVQSFDENPIIDSTGMQLTKSRRFLLVNHGLRLNSIQLNSGYVSGLDGALPAFKKEVVDSVLVNGEFFNSLFFAHKEDWDVSWRLILFNWRIYFNKESKAVHPRSFKPNNLKERLQKDHKIKFDAFKNQFLLLLINEDGKNFVKDSLSIVPRILLTTLFCLLFERKSLKAYSYVLKNRRMILSLRRQVQQKRKIPHSTFRTFITAHS